MLISVLAVFLISGCEDYVDTETASPEVAPNNEGVRFLADNPSIIELLYSDLDFTLTVVRNGTSTAIDVPISATGSHAEYFDVPANVNFATGEDTVAVSLAVKSSAPQGENLKLELWLDEAFANPYFEEYPYFTSQVFVKPPCPYNEIHLAFIFDGYASETTWEIVDDEDNVVASGGPYTDGLATESLDICLEDGTYTFTVEDEYGDGLSYPEDGSVTITLNGVELVKFVGNFGASASETFTLGEE